jgi:hypothetical protein
MCLMMIADRIPPGVVAQIERHHGRFEAEGGGLWRGEIAGLTLRGVETRAAYAGGPTEKLLYIFSRPFLKDPAAILPLDEEEKHIYNLLYQQVEQLRRSPRLMAKEKDEIEVLANNFKDALQETIELLGREKVLARYTPAQRVEGLTLEQRLAGLTPEQLEELAKKLRH